MKPLIDCDILAYEVGFAGQYKDEETGEFVPRDFDDVKELFDHKIKEICEAVWSTEAPLLFFTGDERILRLVNKQRKRDGEEPLHFSPNYRFEIAVSTPYKERKGDKPYHFHNIRAYAFTHYDTNIAWGMEADDAMSIYQLSRLESLDTIICSRDKDLRMVEGWHYGWECHNQPEFGPELVDKIGYLEPPTKKGIKGCGLKFFYAQLITGDRVDSIPGLPRGGPVMAYKLLNECETEEEMYERVAEAYHVRLGEHSESYLAEQCNLLWMVQEVDEDGRPRLFVPPVHRAVSEV